MDVQIVSDIGTHAQNIQQASVLPSAAVWDCLPNFLPSDFSRQESPPVSTKFFQRFFCESLKDGRKWTARCVLCSAVVSAAAGVNSNFKRHLRRYHPVELELFEASRSLVKSVEARSQEDVSSSNVVYCASTSNNSSSSMVDTISSPDQNVGFNEKSRKRDIDDAILLMLCLNVEPFRFVESEGFKHFVKVALPWYEPPSVDSLHSSLLPAKSVQVSNLITFFLNSVDYCSLTFKILLFSDNDSILEVACYFIDKTFLYRSLVLKCHYIPINDDLESVLNDLVKEIASDKIVFVTLNSAIQHFILPGYVEDVKPTTLNENETKPNEVLINKIQNHLSGCFEKMRKCCIVSTMQSVLKDGLDHPQVSSIIHKASFILSMLDDVPNMFQDDVHQANNKWLIQFKKISYLVEKLVESSYFQTSLHLSEEIQLSSLDIKALHELVLAIQPFEDYVEVLQKESATSGMVIPAVIDICNQLTDIISHATTWMGAVVEHLKEVLNQYFADILNENVFQLASALDPRFKLAWCLDNSMKNSIRSLLITEANIVFKANKAIEGNCETSFKTHSSDDRTTAENENTAVGLYHKRPRLFGSLPLRGPITSVHRKPDSCEQEVSLYLDEPVVSDIESKPLEYWRFQCMRYPRLAALASKVLCVPTCFQESDCSMYEKLRQEHNCNAEDCSTKCLENILLIRKNVHLMGFW